MATIEEKVTNLGKRVDHIDQCVDALKRQVWRASGAAVIILGVFQILTK